MSNKVNRECTFANEATECRRPEQGGLRQRTRAKMVPRVSPDFVRNTRSERRRTSSSSEKNEKRLRGDSGTGDNDAYLENPVVLIEDPTTNRTAEICETSFMKNTLDTLDSKAYESRSPTDYLSPTGDISLSSDEENDKVAGSFNSRNLYKPISTDDFDDDNEKSILLPNGELTIIKEKDRDVDIRISTEEKSLNIALQVFFPFLVAGLGTVAAGLLLDVVQVVLIVDLTAHTHFLINHAGFCSVEEVFILKPRHF